MTAQSVIALPPWREVLRQASLTFVVASAVPAGLFYTAMSLFNLRTAAIVALLWYLSLILARRLRRQPVLGAAILGAGLMGLRTLTVLLTGSAWLYFIQPVAGTVATASAFAVTAMAGRPLLDRLAHDFCPIPTELSRRLRREYFFQRVTVAWAGIYVLNAVGTVLLLSYASLGGFLVIKSLMGPVLNGLALTASVLLLRLNARRGGYRLSFTPGAVPVAR